MIFVFLYFNLIFLLALVNLFLSKNLKSFINVKMYPSIIYVFHIGKWGDNFWFEFTVINMYEYIVTIYIINIIRKTSATGKAEKNPYTC